MGEAIDKVAGSDITQLIVDAIGGQADLLFGLAVAICGGIVALSTQIIIHNHGDGNTKVKISGLFLLGLTFLVEGISAFLGYLVKGTLVASIPALYAASYLPNEPLAENALDPVPVLESYALWQFVFFIAGLGLLLILIFKNRKFLN